MTAKCPDRDFENAIQLYVSGESAENAAHKFHTTEKRLVNELRTRGLFRDKAARDAIRNPKIRANSSVRIDLPIDDIVRRYMSGESENMIAKFYGVSRNVITRHIVSAGIHRRANTEANRLLAAQTPQDEHLRRIKIAQDSVRGSTRSFADRCKVAIGRERNGTHISDAERMLCGWLIDRGITPAQQKAIGSYNVDIAFDSIAVEVFGGGWHGYGAHAQRSSKRFKYILDQGWSVVVIWVYDRDCPLGVAAADYLVSYRQQVRSDPSLIGQYRVILGNGQDVTIDGTNLDHISIKPSFASR